MSPGTPRRDWPTRLAIKVVRGYQLMVSPLLGGHCRHFPSCSEYARQAIERFGVLRGGWLTLKRLGRCHPWGTQGYDPVPDDAGAQRQAKGVGS